MSEGVAKAMPCHCRVHIRLRAPVLTFANCTIAAALRSWLLCDNGPPRSERGSAPWERGRPRPHGFEASSRAGDITATVGVFHTVLARTPAMRAGTPALPGYRST